MGAWSTRIFDDDGAEDIRGDYRILLGYGMEPEKAYELIYQEYYSDFKDSDDEDVFWLSVALYQWQNGILREDVKERALDVIANESYLERWKDSGMVVYNKRRKVLSDMRDKLLHEVNPPKKIPKCPAYYRAKTKFKLGDVYAYQHSNGKCSYIQVVEICKIPVSHLCPELDYRSHANFALLDVWSDELLGWEQLQHASYRKMYITHEHDVFRVDFVDVISFWNEKQVALKWIYLGNHDVLVHDKEHKWFGHRAIDEIYESEKVNPYESLCIYPTFHLEARVTNEMLNLAFSVWMEHDDVEKLQELLHARFPEWNDKVCTAIRKVIHRRVQMYVSRLRGDICYGRGSFEMERVYEEMPWLHEQYGLELLELTKKKVENHEFDIWERELMNEMLIAASSKTKKDNI